MGNDLTGRHRFDTFFFFFLLVLVGILCVSHFQVTRVVMGQVGSGGREEERRAAGRRRAVVLCCSLTGVLGASLQVHSGTLRHRQRPSDCFIMGDRWGRLSGTHHFCSGLAVDSSGFGGCNAGVSGALAQAQARDKIKMTMGLTSTSKVTATPY